MCAQFSKKMKRHDPIGIRFLRPVVKVTKTIIENEIKIPVKKQKLNTEEPKMPPVPN
jgi:hypothetical protein